MGGAQGPGTPHLVIAGTLACREVRGKVFQQAAGAEVSLRGGVAAGQPEGGAHGATGGEAGHQDARVTLLHTGRHRGARSGRGRTCYGSLVGAVRGPHPPLGRGGGGGAGQGGSRLHFPPDGHYHLPDTTTHWAGWPRRGERDGCEWGVGHGCGGCDRCGGCCVCWCEWGVGHGCGRRGGGGSSSSVGVWLWLWWCEVHLQMAAC